jgi:hypothetical protein
VRLVWQRFCASEKHALNGIILIIFVIFTWLGKLAMPIPLVTAAGDMMV